MPFILDKEQKSSLDRNGYSIIRDLLTASETEELQRWAQEMPYEEINSDGKRVLCRTENYAGSHAGLNALLRGEHLLSVLRELAGEDMVLFKEKINYKLAGSGGFAAHIDSTAYVQVKQIKHLAILLAVDPSDLSNGGLEVVNGSHRLKVPIGADNCIEPSWIAQQTWTPVELKAGEALIFGSSLAHRSAANTSSQDRKALYATYNVASDGDLHDEYYRRRRTEYPPTHLRKPGERFEAGALRYGYGSPMLSVDLGHQLAV
ncbi:hypothetical protein BAUCODRAFT_152254 [Baudoinia panamericana UAMH 10762]|uniref:Fe2OG dioxygenase domain-containing protein n=1 Tax=Baudoinia panamericana (strain UAMH 10762) TaxID=717646 RepID=M2MYY1_BAUPA|nr:uncharacterized protein BAUCODRAFT_152254 [Baudoinia panamericana UAMH 10762]EMC91894.1 hypothetical protein BAUCODRAFT_152254 [Baudoinia panamericana UAMH 10762]